MFTTSTLGMDISAVFLLLVNLALLGLLVWVAVTGIKFLVWGTKFFKMRIEESAQKNEETPPQKLD